MAAGSHQPGDGKVEPSTISSTLLDRVRARRPEAWQRLVDLYGPVVYRWCRQLGVPSRDAADVVQEVFLTVTTGVGRFRRDRPGDSFGGWLRTITRHRVCDHFRRRRGQAHLGPGNGDGWLTNVAEAEEESLSATPVEKEASFCRRMLELVRAEFENGTWEAFWRTAVDGVAAGEVAAAMGLSVAAVYQAKSRVLRRLRQELGELGAS